MNKPNTPDLMNINEDNTLGEMFNMEYNTNFNHIN